MPSSLNTIELVLGLQDTQPMLTNLSKTEKAAVNIGNSIKNTFTTASAKVSQAVSNMGTQIENYNDSVDVTMYLTAYRLTEMFQNFAQGIKEGYPKLLTSLKTYLEQPLVEKIKIIGGGAVEALSKIMKGQWLIVKTAVLGVSSALLNLTGITQDIARDFIWFASKAKTAMTIVSTYTKGFTRLMWDSGASIVAATKRAGELISKYTGLSYILSGIQKSATIALKVTGFAAAYGVLQSFFFGARGQSSQLFEAFNVIGDTVLAALDPLANMMYELAVRMAPVITEALVPAFIEMSKIMVRIINGFQDMVAHSESFHRVFSTVQEVVATLGTIIGQIVDLVIRDIVPVLGPIFTAALDAVKGLFDTIVPMISELANTLFPRMGDEMNSMSPIIQGLMETLGEAWNVIAMAIGDTLLPIINSFQESLPKIMPVVKELLVATGSLIKGLAPFIALIIKGAGVLFQYLLAPAFVAVFKTLSVVLIETFTILGEILNYFSTGERLDYILGFLQGASEGFRDTMKFIWDVTSTTFGAIVNLLRDSWAIVTELFDFQVVGDKITGAFGMVVAAIKSPIDTLKNFINDTVIWWLRNIYYTDIPGIGNIGYIAGIDNPPQYLAEGGVVMGPVIGEAGPELVLPLKPEVMQRIIPTMVSVNAPMPDTMKLAEGGQITTLLGEIASTMRDVREIMRTPREVRGEMRTRPSVMFTVEGFA